MYVRTARVPAGVVLVGAQIKVPTVLIVSGDADVWTGEVWHHLSGHSVLSGEAGRKQLFVTRSAVEMSMVFPTRATTVAEAEAEFTDDHLMGEQLCRES